MPTENPAPPTRLNLLLLAAASAGSFALLWLATQALGNGSSSGPWRWPVALLAALGFSFSANTLFALLHEAVHGSFARQRTLNRWAGRWAALWFPTSFLVQQAYHLTHHRHNRSPAEQFDVLRPGDARWLKYAQWYAIYTGLYWLVALAGLLAYALTPRAARRWLLRRMGQPAAAQTSANHYAEALERVPALASRLEIAAAIGLHAALLTWGGIAPLAWVLCYAAFALQWSWLQYTDHAFSPLNDRHGAWNLRVNRFTRAMFLNYHLHLAHHQRPELPWNALPRHATPGPRFIDVWLACWRGPRPAHRFPRFAQGPVC
ncbi:MAG: fatty acid desaturase [Pseudomonadota bacterium]|nr:fatty acid desaturase [Pseudomonadota bacterium]